MKTRESGIDLIRCIGLLFVVGVHSFLKNGFYSVPQTGGLIWAADCFRWLFYGCNGIFMMLWYVLSLFACLGMRNAYERTMSFKPTFFNAVTTAILIVYCTLCLSNVSVFLYFNF